MDNNKKNAMFILSMNGYSTRAITRYFNCGWHTANRAILKLGKSKK